MDQETTAEIGLAIVCLILGGLLVLMLFPSPHYVVDLGTNPSTCFVEFGFAGLDTSIVPCETLYDARTPGQSAGTVPPVTEGVRNRTSFIDSTGRRTADWSWKSWRNAVYRFLTLTERLSDRIGIPASLFNFLTVVVIVFPSFWLGVLFYCVLAAPSSGERVQRIEGTFDKDVREDLSKVADGLATLNDNLQMLIRRFPGSPNRIDQDW